MRSRLGPIAAAVILLASCTGQRPEPPSQAVAGAADGDSSALAWPSASKPNGITSGYVDIAFTAEPGGTVRDLKVLKETPEGYGLADAAIRFLSSPDFRLKVSHPIQEPTRGFYRFNFKVVP